MTLPTSGPGTTVSSVLTISGFTGTTANSAMLVIPNADVLSGDPITSGIVYEGIEPAWDGGEYWMYGNTYGNTGNPNGGGWFRESGNVGILNQMHNTTVTNSITSFTSSNNTSNGQLLLYTNVTQGTNSYNFNNGTSDRIQQVPAYQYSPATGSYSYQVGRAGTNPGITPATSGRTAFHYVVKNTALTSGQVAALYALYITTLGSNLKNFGTPQSYSTNTPLVTSFTPTTIPPGQYSDGLQEFQAYGDWNGYNWINKYAAPVSTIRTITGSSNLFNIYPEQGQFNIAKINENWNASGYYDSLRFQETLLDKQVFFDQFLGVIVGSLHAQPYELGKTIYEKIANFVDNNADIDKVNINELISFCNELSIEFNQYNIIYPPQLRRLVDLLSIKQSKLWGTTNKYGTNFDPRGTLFPNSTYGINLSSSIDPLTGTFLNGVPIVAQEIFSGNYKIVNTNFIDNKYATQNNDRFVTLFNTITTDYRITVTGAGDINSNGIYVNKVTTPPYNRYIFTNIDPNSNYYINFTPSIFTGSTDQWSIVNPDNPDVDSVYTLTSAFSAIYKPNSNWMATDPAYLPSPSTTFTTNTSTYQVSSYTALAKPSIPLSSYTPDWGWGLVAPDIIGPQISTYYTFYQYNPVYNNTYYDNIINWNDPYTTLLPTNSAYVDWSENNGIIQSLLSYEISKGFRLFTSAANITYNN